MFHSWHGSEHVAFRGRVTAGHQRGCEGCGMVQLTPGKAEVMEIQAGRAQALPQAGGLRGKAASSPWVRGTRSGAVPWGSPCFGRGCGACVLGVQHPDIWERAQERRQTSEAGSWERDKESISTTHKSKPSGANLLSRWCKQAALSCLGTPTASSYSRFPFLIKPFAIL